MASRPSARSQNRNHPNLREALDPLVDASSSQTASSSKKLDFISKAILAPFTHRKGDSSKIFTDLAPVIMTPRMMNAASMASSKPRSSIGMTGSPMDFATLGRAPMRLSLGTRRITSTDLQIVEATDELLTADIPEPEGVAADVSLLRGFNATVPSSERGKTRRRQMRNVDAPRMGLKRLGMSARGLMMDEEEESIVSEDDDMVLVGHSEKGKGKGKGKGKRRGRESLGASVSLGKEELTRQTKEIMRDKENIHIRRALVNNEITEITHKIEALDAIRAKLEQDLLRLQEEELELDDELEGVRERMDFEQATSNIAKRAPVQATHVAQSSRRRKGPAFLPSEHDELPPGVAFMTLSAHTTPITALDFSEPYGTLVSAAQEDAAPRVWDLLSGAELARLHGHTGPVRVLQVEDHVCLTGGADGGVRVWDLRRVDDPSVDEDMFSLSDVAEEESVGGEEADPRPNGIRSADAGAEEEKDGPCARVLEGHSKAVTALYFEDNCLVTGASDKTLRQWDLTTGQCVMTMDILWAIAHPNTNPAGSALPYHLFPGAVTGHFAVPTPPYADGSWDMYQDFVGDVQFWGYALVSGSGDGAVRMWDMRTGQAHRTLLGHTAPVTCLQFDELHIISGGLDKAIRIWDLRTGGIFDTIKYDHGVTSLQFDSRKIVAATGENGVKIYNRTTMQHSTLSTNGHTKPVEKLRYMDRYLISGARDSTLKIWAL